MTDDSPPKKLTIHSVRIGETSTLLQAMSSNGENTLKTGFRYQTPAGFANPENPDDGRIEDGLRLREDDHLAQLRPRRAVFGHF